MWDNLANRAQSYRENQQAKKGADIFKAQMEFMKTIDVFTLRNYIEMLQDIKKQSGVDGWTKVMRSAEQQKEMEQMMADVTIGEKLSPQEVRKPNLIGRREKLRIASEAGVELPKVNQFFKSYEQMQAMHRWLHRRMRESKPVPESMEEFLRMSATDPAGLNTNASGKPGKGRGRLGVTGAHVNDW